MSENRREFFRVIFDRFINGKVSMDEAESFPVKIDNMSVGGLEFNSSIEIPMHKRVQCSFNILESSFVIDGSIVRRNPKINYIEYGVVFEIDLETSSQLFKQLNFYQIRQRKGKLVE